MAFLSGLFNAAKGFLAPLAAPLLGQGVEMVKNLIGGTGGDIVGTIGQKGSNFMQNIGQRGIQAITNRFGERAGQFVGGIGSQLAGAGQQMLKRKMCDAERRQISELEEQVQQLKRVNRGYEAQENQNNFDQLPNNYEY
jgi:hypothetical protein